MPGRGTDAADAAASLYSYSDTVAAFIDVCAPPAAGERSEVPFLRARIPEGARVLDIGAGAGELALQLAAKGYRVTALEPDPGMYGVLLVRLASLAGVRDLSPVPRAIGFELGTRFAACLALAVMHHLDGAGRRGLFQYAAAHLQPGGMLVVDAPVESTGRSEVPHQLRSERLFGATRFQHWHSVRRVGGGRWQTVWEFVTLRGSEELDRRARVFDWSTSSGEEVSALAGEAGLGVEEILAGFDGTPFARGGDSRSVVAVLRKPA